MQATREIEEGPGRPPLFAVTSCRHPDRTVYVQLALFGQFRVILCERPRPGGVEWHGHGEILRLCCTYDGAKALETVVELASSADPDGYLEALARPWNCEHPGGRIRLDSRPPEEPEGRPELWLAAGAPS